MSIGRHTVAIEPSELFQDGIVCDCRIDGHLAFTGTLADVLDSIARAFGLEPPGEAPPEADPLLDDPDPLAERRWARLGEAPDLSRFPA